MKSLLLIPLVATPTLLPTAAADETSCSSQSYAAAEKNVVETALAAGKFNTLAAALGAAGLVDALQGEGPFTVFAPTDDAFAKLPEKTLANLLKPENKGLLTAILTYHVVGAKAPAVEVVEAAYLTTLNGQRIDVKVGEHGVTIDGARVTTTDIVCSNGVIHVIDSVLLPETDDIVETAVAAGSFETLVAAVKAAGLVEALRSEGPFTVFAPTDEAFAALGQETIASLLKPENKDQLTAILKFHVAAGRVYGDQASAADHLATLQGGDLTPKVVDGKLTINGANVVGADIETSNGVIHVIDRVLLP